VDIDTPDSIFTALCALAAMMLFFTVMYPVGRSGARRKQVDSRRIVPTGIPVELMPVPFREKAFSVRMIPNHVISESVV